MPRCGCLSTKPRRAALSWNTTSPPPSSVSIEMHGSPPWPKRWTGNWKHWSRRQGDGTREAGRKLKGETLMNHTLQNKRALVTGGSRGIGAAIVKRLAGEGAHVALTYVSK